MRRTVARLANANGLRDQILKTIGPPGNNSPLGPPPCTKRLGHTQSRKGKEKHLKNPRYGVISIKLMVTRSTGVLITRINRADLLNKNGEDFLNMTGADPLQEWCANHQAYGHSTEECRKGKSPSLEGSKGAKGKTKSPNRAWKSDNFPATNDPYITFAYSLLDPIHQDIVSRFQSLVALAQQRHQSA